MKEPKITDRAAAVKALKLAKKRLWNGRLGGRWMEKELHICTALGYVGSAVPDLRRASDELREIIAHRLQGSATLGGWLVQKHGIHVYDVPRTRLQATRHAWVDSLIKEFSK